MVIRSNVIESLCKLLYINWHHIFQLNENEVYYSYIDWDNILKIDINGYHIVYILFEKIMGNEKIMRVTVSIDMPAKAIRSSDFNDNAYHRKVIDEFYYDKDSDEILLAMMLGINKYTRSCDMDNEELNRMVVLYKAIKHIEKKWYE